MVFLLHFVVLSCRKRFSRFYVLRGLPCIVHGDRHLYPLRLCHNVSSPSYMLGIAEHAECSASSWTQVSPCRVKCQDVFHCSYIILVHSAIVAAHRLFGVILSRTHVCSTGRLCLTKYGRCSFWSVELQGRYTSHRGGSVGSTRVPPVDICSLCPSANRVGDGATYRRLARPAVASVCGEHLVACPHCLQRHLPHLSP